VCVLFCPIRFAFFQTQRLNFSFRGRSMTHASVTQIFQSHLENHEMIKPNRRTYRRFFFCVSRRPFFFSFETIINRSFVRHLSSVAKTFLLLFFILIWCCCYCDLHYYINKKKSPKQVFCARHSTGNNESD